MMRGIIALGILLVLAGAGWQIYTIGQSTGYAKKAQEISKDTESVNQKNEPLGEVAQKAIQADQGRQERVRVINNEDMTCLVTKQFAQRFAE